VQPAHSFAITIAFQLVILTKLWFAPTYKSFLTALTLCGYAAFLFGWHVHEKAVLLVLVPLNLMAAERHSYFRTFIITNVAGVFSLFPLIFTPAESIIKAVYSALWIALVYVLLARRVYEFPPSLGFVVLDALEKVYLAGFPLLLAFVSLLPMLNRHTSASMEFLPLLATSVYCAIGLVWGFIRLLVVYLNEENTCQV